jgi:hypothetical protein
VVIFTTTQFLTLGGTSGVHREEIGQLRVRFEVITALIMKNVVFWDIKTQFFPHRGHIASPLQIKAG